MLEPAFLVVIYVFYEIAFFYVVIIAYFCRN